MTISVKDSYFGAKGDGVADDTAAIHRAFDHAKSISAEVVFPPGVYRITSGYRQAVARNNLFLRGPGRINEPSASTGALILLDSTDPASFFLDLAASMTLASSGLMYQCAQFVKDRDFFRFSAGLVAHSFRDGSFEAVERPIVYKPGVYAQNPSLRDVQFRNSGTIHSESSALVVTDLRLDNVNHEGAVPENTEKVVCNLQGIRGISGDNNILEGALPSPGWTILKLHNEYDAAYTRAPFADLRGLHSEWAGIPPAYVVDQISGAARISTLVGLSSGSKYRLSNMAKVTVADTSFSGTGEDPATFFELEDSQCVVQFSGCAMRNTASLSAPGFHHHNTQRASITSGQGQVILSNDAAQEVYRWDGWNASPNLYGGTGFSMAPDAIYGRKMLFTPYAGAVNAALTTPNRGLVAGDQLVMAVKAKLPNFTAGQWAFVLTLNGIGTVRQYFDTSYAGATVDVLIPWVLLTAPATFAIGFSNGTSSGATTDLEVFAAVMYHGNSVPRRQVPNYKL